MTYLKETNADSLIKRTIFLVINSQLSLLYNFSKFLYIFTLFIHPSTLNVTNITPHSPDDGSAEPKHYSVDWLCFPINPYLLFGLLVVNFSSQIVGLLSIIFFHIYIYIYIYIYIHGPVKNIYIVPTYWSSGESVRQWPGGPWFNPRSSPSIGSKNGTWYLLAEHSAL